MLQEVYNVNLERPDEFPEIRGWTTLVVSSEYQIEDVLRKIRQVCHEVAK